MNKNLTFDEQPIDFFFPDPQQTFGCFPLAPPTISQAFTTKSVYSVSDEYEKAIEENIVLNRKPLLSWHLQPNTANDYDDDLFSLFSDNPTPSGDNVLLNSVDPYSDDEKVVFEKQNPFNKSKSNRVINKQDLENFKTKEILTKCSKHHEKVKSELLNRHVLKTKNAILTNQKFLTYNEKKVKKKSKQLIIPFKKITKGQLPQENTTNNNNSNTGFKFHKKITKIPIKNKNMIQPLLEEAQAFLDNYRQNDQDLMTEEEKILLKKMTKKELSKLSSLEKKNRKRARDRLSARRVRIKQQAYVKYLKNHISNLQNENSTLENRLSTRLLEKKKLQLRIQNLKTRKKLNKISKGKNRKLLNNNNVKNKKK